MCYVINISHLPRSTVHFTRTFDSCARNAERCHGVSRILRQFYFYKVKKNLWQAWQGSKIELKSLILLTNSIAKGGGLQWQGLARLLVLLAFLHFCFGKVFKSIDFTSFFRNVLCEETFFWFLKKQNCLKIPLIVKE